jgi:hypothetical protein
MCHPKVIPSPILSPLILVFPFSSPSILSFSPPHTTLSLRFRTCLSPSCLYVSPLILFLCDLVSTALSRPSFHCLQLLTHHLYFFCLCLCVWLSLLCLLLSHMHKHSITQHQYSSCSFLIQAFQQPATSNQHMSFTIPSPHHHVNTTPTRPTPTSIPDT